MLLNLILRLREKKFCLSYKQHQKHEKYLKGNMSVMDFFEEKKINVIVMKLIIHLFKINSIIRNVILFSSLKFLI